MYNHIMFRNLRIAFSILAAICAAAALFVFVYAPHIGWGFLCVAGAAVFFMLTLLFKRKQEEKELKENPPPPVGDFITGKVPLKNDTGDITPDDAAGDGNEESNDTEGGGNA